MSWWNREVCTQSGHAQRGQVRGRGGEPSTDQGHRPAHTLPSACPGPGSLTPGWLAVSLTGDRTFLWPEPPVWGSLSQQSWYTNNFTNKTLTYNIIYNDEGSSYFVSRFSPWNWRWGRTIRICNTMCTWSKLYFCVCRNCKLQCISLPAAFFPRVFSFLGSPLF